MSETGKEAVYELNRVFDTRTMSMRDVLTVTKEVARSEGIDEVESSDVHSESVADEAPVAKKTKRRVRRKKKDA